MPTVSCPFCFELIDSSRLAFQCLGRGLPRCERTSDPVREQLTRSKAESFPTFTVAGNRVPSKAKCPHCAGDTPRRACPTCHTALQTDFVDSESLFFSIVGPRSSGKTVWMTVLARQLREVVSVRFGADIGFATDNPDGATSMGQWLATREDAIFHQHQLPAPTQTRETQTRPPLVMRWRSRSEGWRQQTRSRILSFLDTGGEDVANLEVAFNLQYLARSTGIIVLLDPFRFSSARAMASLPDAALRHGDGGPTDVIERLTEQLRIEHDVKTNKRIKLPIAVVFTKLDAFFDHLEPGSPLRSDVSPLPAYDDVGGRAAHEHVRALMGRWNALSLDNHMQANYDTYRYFAVSSLGAQPQYDAGTVSAGGVKPHRVEEPVLWLLNRSGVLQR